MKISTNFGYKITEIWAFTQHQTCFVYIVNRMFTFVKKFVFLMMRQYFGTQIATYIKKKKLGE